MVDGPPGFSLKCNRSKPNSASLRNFPYRKKKIFKQSNDTVFGVNVADKAASDTFAYGSILREFSRVVCLMTFRERVKSAVCLKRVSSGIGHHTSELKGSRLRLRVAQGTRIS